MGRREIQMKVRQVIFDLGGVLVEWNPHSLVKKHIEDEAVQAIVLNEILLHPDWLELDKGSISESEAAIQISQRSSLNHNFVLEIFERVREFFTLIEQSEDLLNKLVDHGIPCYALSNMSVENYEYLSSNFDFFKQFKGAVISGHESLIKPDQEIYRLICERFQLNPAETLFIDDTLANCEAAQSVGMQTVHFDRDYPLNIDKIICAEPALVG